MKAINDALVSVAVELILMIPATVKRIIKRYKIKKNKKQKNDEEPTKI